MDYLEDVLFRKFLTEQKNKHLALDLGCASRGAISVLSRNYEAVVGVDMCKHYPKHYSLERNKAYARKNHLDNVEYVQAEAHYLPFKNEVFDGIVCSHVMEHFMNPTQALVGIHKILRQNGTFFMAVPWLSEIWAMNFSHNPLSQWGKLLLTLMLDRIRQGKYGLLERIFFQKKHGSVMLRSFMPKTYTASAWYRGKIKLQTYVDNFFEGKLRDPHHKHWLTRQQWLEIVSNAGMSIISYQGMKNISILAK